MSEIEFDGVRFEVNLTDINYIPSYKIAEEERRINEENRIKNEVERNNYYNSLKKQVDIGELDGATFIPNIDEEGNLSWTNDKGLTNPTSVNIKGVQGVQGEKGDRGDQGSQGNIGPQGMQGEKGEKGDPFLYEDFTEEQLASLKGPKGDKGDIGPQGEKGEPYIITETDYDNIANVVLSKMTNAEEVAY